MSLDSPDNRGPGTAEDLLHFTILGAMGEAARTQVLPFLLRRRLRTRGELDGAIFHDRIGLVWSGRFRLATLGAKSRRCNLQRYKSGAIIGLEHLGRAPHPDAPHSSLVCDAAGLILTIPQRHLLAAAGECPKFWRAVAEANGATSVEYGVRFHRMAVEDVRERTISYLRQLAEDGQDASIRPAPRTSEIAVEIGASREAVTRVMRMLQDEGLVVAQAGAIELTGLLPHPRSPGRSGRH